MTVKECEYKYTVARTLCFYSQFFFFIFVTFICSLCMYVCTYVCVYICRLCVCMGHSFYVAVRSHEGGSLFYPSTM